MLTKSATTERSNETQTYLLPLKTLQTLSPFSVSKNQSKHELNGEEQTILINICFHSA